MIDGMVPFSMRGVIWYQGEDDGRNKNYASDLTALIESYRNLWKKDDLAFHMVQIAQTTYASGMLGVYQAQVAVTEKHSLPATPSRLLHAPRQWESGDFHTSVTIPLPPRREPRSSPRGEK
jgi:hypothetical protein